MASYQQILIVQAADAAEYELMKSFLQAKQSKVIADHGPATFDDAALTATMTKIDGLVPAIYWSS
jgi:hypothetical protein